MGRAVAKTLKETTLQSFFDAAAGEGLRNGEHYTYNGQSGVITVGKSTILLKDLASTPSDPNFDELGSLELTGAFIDEANQITEKAKEIIGSRVRYKLDEFGLIPKTLMTCNPSKNWVYRDFYAPWRKDELPAHMAFVQALVTDNPNISPHYIEKLKRLKGTDRERLLLGNWDYDDADWQLMPTESIYNLWVNEGERGQGALTWDVAGPGSDKSIVFVYSGFVVTYIEVLKGDDINVHAVRVDAIAKEHGVPRNRMVVDATGIGTGPSQYLRGCIAFNGGESPIMNKDYKNLKSECCFQLADAVNSSRFAVEVDTDRDQIAIELATIKQWKGETDMRIQVMPKSEVRKTLGCSPDYADNFMMRMRLELEPSTQGFERVIDNILENKGKEMHREAVDRMFNIIPKANDRDY